MQLPRGHAAEYYADVLRAYRDALHRHWGRDTPERLAIARCVYVGTDDESAVAEAGPSITRFYTSAKSTPKDKPVPSVPELIAQMNFIVGGPEKCAREIAALPGGDRYSATSVSQPTWIGLLHDAAMAFAASPGRGGDAEGGDDVCCNGIEATSLLIRATLPVALLPTFVVSMLQSVAFLVLQARR